MNFNSSFLLGTTTVVVTTDYYYCAASLVKHKNASGCLADIDVYHDSSLTRRGAQHPTRSTSFFREPAMTTGGTRVAVCASIASCPYRLLGYAYPHNIPEQAHVSPL